jgi:type VI secretion system protein ImpJ|tara:strand:- start:973 stop:2328 length:1356 start_codon:yes stop_codon:yes gene_type:complete
MLSNIHWHEGLFLRPHHLQRFHQDLQRSAISERQMYCPIPYGVLQYKVNDEELANKRLKFDHLKVIMPSGVIVDFPERATLPALDLRESLARHQSGFVVSLSVPFWDSNRGNVATPSSTGQTGEKLLYTTDEIEVSDENTGMNPQPLAIRKINAKLIVSTDESSYSEMLPLVRLSAGVGENLGQAQLDPRYSPPAVYLKGSVNIRSMMGEFVRGLIESRNALSVQIGQGGFNIETLRGIQLEQIFRLRTLSRYAARLPLMMQTDTVSLYSVFMELHGLLGELNALSPTEDFFNQANFNHDDPFSGFRTLIDKLSSLMKGVTRASYIKIDFAKQDDHYACEITDEHLNGVIDYYVGIESSIEHRQLTMLVEDPDKFKFMPVSFIKRPIFGIRLKEERVPPLELPAKSNLRYYRLLRAESEKIWKIVQREKKLAMRWPGVRGSDFKIGLYILK